MGVIARVKLKLIAVFAIVGMGPNSFYLSLKVDKYYQKKFSQSVYIQNILTKYYFDKANPTNISIKKIAQRLIFFTKVIKTKKKKVLRNNWFTNILNDKNLT